MEPISAPPRDPRRDFNAFLVRLADRPAAALLRAFVENSPVLFGALDRTGRMVYANDAFFGFYGTLPPPDLSIFDDPFLRASGRIDTIRRAFAGETVRVAETMVNPNRADRSMPDIERHVEGFIQPLENAKGEVDLFLLILTDVTARMEAERRLRESLETARVLLNAAHGPFILVDRAGILLDCNDALAARYGGRREEILGRDIYALMPPETAAARRERAARVFATGLPEHFTEQGSDGGIYETDVYPVRDATGGVTRLVIHSRDVTEERRRAEALAEARRLELIGRLAGGVAHDFNNLLTGVRGHLTLLEASLAETGRERIRRIEALVERGANLVRRLLDIARGTPHERRPVDLVPLVRDLLPLFSGPRRGITLEFHTSVSSLVAEVDPVQVEQILLNLLFNAAEAMRDFGTILVSLAPARLGETETLRLAVSPGEYALLSVADDGPGIPPDRLPHIFQPFFSTKAEEYARGTGLTSALDLARAHEGTIECQSAPGEGAVFRVYLPLARPARDAQEPRAASGKVSSV